VSLEVLNRLYGLDGKIIFSKGAGDFVYAEIRTAVSNARICLYGGQVLSFTPVKVGNDVFFVSSKSYFARGQPIKGGVPICWPWFGADPEHRGRGSHGFTRNLNWNVQKVDFTNDAVSIRLKLDSNSISQEVWPFKSELDLNITVSETLEICLTTSNTGDQPMPVSQALHSYFPVGQINQTSVTGFDNCPYLDSIDNAIEKNQQGDILFSEEVDRIYLRSPDIQIIEDRSKGRQISIDSAGSGSTVVWNPWIDKSIAMGDFGDDDYQVMLCVETANAGPDLIQIEAGGQHSIKLSISVQSNLNIKPLDN
jgi:glucose-6-phosphate 1-epimerase